MSENTKDELNITEADLKHFHHLENEMEKAGIGGAAASVNVADLCKQYHKIEPALKAVLPFVKLIPKVGKTAAQAIEFLMSIAAISCPIE